MSLKIINVTPNIQTVSVDQADGQYNLTTTVKFLAKDLQTIPRDYFVLYSTSQDLTNQLIGNTGLISRYISRRETNDNLIVVHDTVQNTNLQRLRYASNYQNIVDTNEVAIPRDQINNLAVLVVTARKSQRRKSVSYAVINMDVLKVLQDGAPPQNNVVLYENQQQTNIWLGPFFVDNQGMYRKTNGDELYSKQVPNTKVIFKSLLSKTLLQTISNNFDSLFDFNRGLNSRSSIFNKLSTEHTNYFSDLYFAKTKNIDLPLSFTFNKLAYYQNGTLFGRLIKNQSQLLASADIKDVRFIRKRVSHFSPSSRLTAAGPTHDMDKEEYPLSEETNFVNLLNSDSFVTVQTTDTDIKNKTYGLYQYGVEITLIDRTAQVILDSINNPSDGLSTQLSKLKDVYAEASLPNNYNVYSKDFFDSYKKRYNTSRKSVVIEAIKKYVQVLSIFYKNFSLSLQESPNSLALKIYEAVDPIVVGPEGLLNLQELIGSLITEMSIFIKRGSIKPGSAQNVNTKTAKLGNSFRIVKTKHFFNQVVDAEDLVNNGYDYLSVQEASAEQPTYSNFRILSFSEFDSVKNTEITKYDNLAFSDKDDVSLTPNYFSLYGQQNKINLPDPITDTNDQAIATKILVSNELRNSPIDLSALDMNNNTTDISDPTLQTIKNSVVMMDRNDCTVSINVENQESTLFAESQTLQDADDYIDAAEKLSEQSPFVINKTGSVSLNNFIFSLANNNTEATYLNQIKNLDVNMLSYLIQTDYFTVNTQKRKSKVKNLTDGKVFGTKNNTFETFNQEVIDQTAEKSTRSTTLPTIFSPTITTEFYPPQELIYANEVSTPISASQAATVALKFGNIRKIEYLAGFKRSDNTVFMKEPIWISLTQGLLTNIVNTNTTLLCRFVKYSSLFSKYEGVDFPIYDELFLIGPAPVSNNADTATAPQLSFSQLEQATDNTQDDSEFAFASVADVPFVQNNTPVQAQNFEITNNPDQDLYTNGNDFLLPNGDKYVGPYHIHYSQQQRKFIAMVGKTHTAVPHDVLTPVSNRARRILRNATMNSSNNVPAPPAFPGTPGTPNGTGGSY